MEGSNQQAQNTHQNSLNYTQPHQGPPPDPEEETQQQIHNYEAQYQLYAMGFANKNENRFRLACASKIESVQNYVEVLEKRNDGIVRLSQTRHPLPPSKLEWIPDYNNHHLDLLATTADYLRLWEVNSDTQELQLKHLFSVKAQSSPDGSVQAHGQSALTAFDWNRVTLNLIGTAATDTTCTIWDIEAMAVKTQLIAHDMDVFDFAWAQSDVQFATASADGSVRLFDLRDLGISTVMYQSPGPLPMLRAVWNRQDYHYLAVITMDCQTVSIIDTRIPMYPVAELRGHNDFVNALAWAPTSNCFLCSVADDCKALIWDISILPNPIDTPILSYNAQAEPVALEWSVTRSDWVAIIFDKRLQMLRV